MPRRKAMGKTSRSRLKDETPLPVCGHVAHSKSSNEYLTSCVRMPKHSGNHVYCVKVKAGIDHDSHALHYHEELKPKILKPILVVDMAGKELCTDEECAAIFQYMEWHREND